MFICVHPRPIRSFVFKSLANIKSVFICVYLCPDKKFFACGFAALCSLRPRAQRAREKPLSLSHLQDRPDEIFGSKLAVGPLGAGVLAAEKSLHDLLHGPALRLELFGLSGEGP